jgi:predicted ATP-grasp superfamily ATP-dependent carboligase
VTVIAFESDDPALQSRYPSQKFAIHGETVEEKDSRLLAILDELPADGSALLATSDRLVTLISDHRLLLQEKFRFVLPPAEILDSLNDKSREVSMLQSFGFQIPKTVTELPYDPITLQSQLRFPIIFKPHSFAAQKFFPPKNAVVNDLQELQDFYLHWRAALPHLLAQEVITGSDRLSWVCSCTFNRQHELLDCGVKQKIRCLPAHFGGSTFAVSRDNPSVLELARSIGQKINYVGHAGIEFRWDERDECYRFIEVKPRIPANVGFDEDCGLSTVWNSYLVALGRTPEGAPARQKEDVYFIDLTGDISSLVADKTPVLGIAKALLSLFFRRTSGLYFAWDDPIPGFLIGYRYALRIAGKITSRFVRRN